MHSGTHVVNLNLKRSPGRLMSVPSEDHKSDVKSNRRGDQLIAKRQALELVPHDVSLPFSV
jgi:hypothetical protein